MKYLLDTDWSIHCLHRVERVVARLTELRPEGVGISIISLAELYQGVFYATDPVGNERALRDFLAPFPVVPLEDEICRIFARERGRLKAMGTPIGDFDLLIGATALQHNLTLLSNNRRHFERISGLSILSV